MNKLFERIFFKNNTSPDLNETNLNAISKGLDDLDTRVAGMYSSVEALDASVAESIRSAEIARKYASDVYHYTPEGYPDLVATAERADSTATTANSTANSANATALSAQNYAIKDYATSGENTNPDLCTSGNYKGYVIENGTYFTWSQIDCGSFQTQIKGENGNGNLYTRTKFVTSDWQNVPWEKLVTKSEIDNKIRMGTWIPSNGYNPLADSKKGFFVYSVNPNLMISQGCPEGLSVYGSVIGCNYQTYGIMLYIDVFGNLAIWSTNSVGWKIYSRN